MTVAPAQDSATIDGARQLNDGDRDSDRGGKMDGGLDRVHKEATSGLSRLANHDDSTFGQTFDRNVTQPIDQLRHEVERFRPLLKAYIAECNRTGTKFRYDGNLHGFMFPRDFSIGAIRVGNSRPLPATQLVPVPANVDVCLYLDSSTKESPELLDLFGPEDLTGLQFVWSEPAECLNQAAKMETAERVGRFSNT